MVIKEILMRRTLFPEVSFIHEWRGTNGEAHRLSRATTSLDSGRHVWFIDPPSGMGIDVNNLLSNKASAVGTLSSKKKNFRFVLIPFW
jgi:hypothetical protein